MKTRIIVSGQHDPYLNLAVETYLTDHQEEGVVTLYLWRNQQTVVIGLNQNPFSECDVRRLNAEGGHLMRRRTGGGAVYHDLGNLNFSFIADKHDYDVHRQLSVIQEALKSFGLDAEVSGRNDLTCQGRKFSGNAFFNGSDNNLHHGTILIKTDAEMMQRYLTVKPSKLQKHGVQSVRSRVVNLSELADITADNIVEPLIQAFETVYDKKAERISFDELARLDEVQKTVAHISSYDYLYGRWEHFHATKQAQFPWGHVEVGYEYDENTHDVKGVSIASDCLDTETISICNDILNLIYQ
ncbi:MAG: lipoate--protein ligase [Bacteroidales bacterium]|nr:lipoate--protein ligase [Bacteroidales bacterium]